MTRPSDALPPSRGTVLYYAVRQHEPAHEKYVHRNLGQQLACLLNMTYAGDHTAQHHHQPPIYFIPSSTIVGLPQAQALDIHQETDLFGGVVPHAFIGTKAITHPLIAPHAHAPTGWSHDFPERVKTSVLKGYTAFSLADAKQAGLDLLEHGPVRIKPVHATGGRGQTLVNNPAALDTALEKHEEDQITHDGIVLEEHLEQVQTYSVGQVRVAGLQASYVGQQRLTSNNSGELVYGGSDLLVARGGFDDLLCLNLEPCFKVAIMQARVYDEAASACFPGFFASRRNYDTACGLNSKGRYTSGVLEQSWRVGGASTAEVAALTQFQANPELRTLYACTAETFGDQHSDLPPEAVECFHGIDEGIGLIRKFVWVKDYDDQ
ncbi:MAG: DUF3182 family protein [Burkholderiaceae bacterium]|nr:DUF3182 family protein [Burkholderiaceae bacterium]